LVKHIGVGKVNGRFKGRRNMLNGKGKKKMKLTLMKPAKPWGTLSDGWGKGPLGRKIKKRGKGGKGWGVG